MNFEAQVPEQYNKTSQAMETIEEITRKKNSERLRMPLGMKNPIAHRLNIGNGQKGWKNSREKTYR